MKRRAFTLLELLITLSIVGIVASLIFAGVNSVRRSGALTREVAAARHLITAYLRAASDRSGELLVGYAAHEGALDDRGNEVPNPACGRYPWRLAPYLDYRLRGSLLVNEQEEIANTKDHGDFVYRASAHPSFGINATYVGGNERTGLMPTPATIRRYGKFYATNLAEVAEPGKLLIFASAHFTGNAQPGDRLSKGKSEGFHLLSPPHTTRREWAPKYDKRLPAEKFGFVALRYSGRAVCAMLGGNVELRDAQQMRDMRHWSVAAAQEDNPDFLLEPLPNIPR